MTTEQRQFIAAYMETRKATEAMLKLYPDMDRKKAGDIGSRYLRNPDVRHEIDLAEDAARVVNALTASERRSWIADLVRTDVRKAHTTHPHIIQSYKATRRILETGEVEETLTVKLPDKLRAIEIDAKLDSVGDTADGDTALLLDGIAEIMGVTIAAPAPAQPSVPALMDTELDLDNAIDDAV
jgi:phage terminase small subunit